MSKQIISTFLVLLLMVPLLQSVAADDGQGPDLEAKNLTATFDGENETTTLSWGNMDTNDFLILDELKTTTYALYRSDEPLNSSNYNNAELLEEGIQACLATDTYAECKERTHSVTKAIPPSTNSSFYYGIVSILQNGSIISNFTEGDAALSQPIHEFGSPITSPYALQGSYDTTNSTTTLTWIDIGTVDATVSELHTSTIWSHAEAATSANWDALMKTEIVANLSSDVTEYHIIHQQPVSQTSFYTVLHSFDGESDVRLLSGNTMTQGIVEDNTGSTIDGSLTISFDSTTSITSLDWNGSSIEDANHTLHIWRSPADIVDITSEWVVEIAQLPATTTEYNYSVETSYSGQTFYLVTLSDQFGNHQSNLEIAPNGVVFEYTLLPEENIIDDISATFEDGMTQITWTDLAGHPEAQYQVWRSSVGRINTTALSGSTVELLAIVDSGQEHYDHTIEAGTSENAWYAVTVIASFGTQDVTYAQTNITMSYNSMMLSIVEDTLPPTAPSALNADYFANGSIQLRWAGSANEDGTNWMLYRNLNSDLSEESFWIPVGDMLNEGVSLHTLYVDTVAQEGELVNAVYAIGGVDAYGNTIEFSDWKLSAVVNEDRQSPQLQLKLFDSSQSLETSRWFTGGESSTFSNLESGDYTMQFTFSNDVVSVSYLSSIETESKTLDLSQANPHIDVSLADEQENVTISFTVVDEAGNSMTFDTLFCTGCLIEPQIVFQPSESTDVVDEEQDKSSESNEDLFVGLSALLGVLVLLLLVRGSPKKAPRGLPTTEEDQWFEKFYNE